MKKIYTILLICLASLAAFSCDKPEEQQEEGSVIAVTESDLTISCKGGEATIKFVSELPVKVTVDKDWCTATVNDTLATFSAPANDSFESRYTRVVVKAGDETLYFTVQQFGFHTSGFVPSDIKASSDAAEFDFPYEYEDMIVASSDADWITLTATGDNLHVAIAENETIGSPENPARYAEISWSLGHDSGVIGVSQNNLSFMRADANWTVHYDGVHDYQGQDAAFISNDVADPSVSGKYSIYAVPKADFTASGMEMGDFVLVVADECREEIEAVIEYYGQFGYNLSFADFLYEESDYEIFSPFDDGDYLAFAIGFTDDAAVTGHYAYSEFTVKSSSGATGYEAWLGEWEIARGGSTDTWKITADKQGSTYTIVGIEGKTYPVAASYDSSADELVVRAQAGIGTYSSSNYGECEVGLYGGWGASSFATGTYIIFTGKAKGDKATLSAGRVSFSDGSAYDLERVQFIATTSDGKYLTITKDRTSLPSTLTRKGSGGGNEGDGSASYNKWLGSWSVDSGAFDITLSQHVADKSVYMRGWQFDEDFFSSTDCAYGTDGTITIPADTDTPVASNVNIGAEDDPCNLYYAGFFIYDDGGEYFIGGSYDAVLGTLQSDGSAVFTGLSVKLTSGKSYTLTRLGLIAVPVSDPDAESVYTFNSMPNEFPLTAVKSGTSSVKTMDVQARDSWVKIPATKVFALDAADSQVEICTPYQALPELPLQYVRHIKLN